MKIFIICPVRDVSDDFKKGIEDYVEELENQGIEVYYPARDTNQKETGYNICSENRKAIEQADEIHIGWDEKSKGSLFDLGMAFMLRKKIKHIEGLFPEKTKHKSFQNVVYHLEKFDTDNKEILKQDKELLEREKRKGEIANLRNPEFDDFVKNTVKELTNKLLNLREDLQDKEIYILAENGLKITPVIKLELKDITDPFNRSADNVEEIVLTW